MHDFDVELERYLHARRKAKLSLREFFSKIWKPVVKEVKKEAKEIESESIREMKEISRIALGVIRQLPDEELKKFKLSSDFERLKEILRKNKLIR